MTGAATRGEGTVEGLQTVAQAAGGHGQGGMCGRRPDIHTHHQGNPAAKRVSEFPPTETGWSPRRRILRVQGSSKAGVNELLILGPNSHFSFLGLASHVQTLFL